MKKQILRFTLNLVMVYLAGNTLNPAVAASEASDEDEVHFCGVTDDFLANQVSNQSHNRRYARSLSSNLNIGEPRTVRMIYFLPSDREYHAATVRQMKNDIHKVQTFYAQQMEAHGYGASTFPIETNPKGDPVVHRVDGEHPESHYLNDAISTVVPESEREFNLDANIYVIVVDNSSGSIGLDAARTGGIGRRMGKHGGWAMVPAPFKETSTHVIAHELGHAFGLYHDFTNPVYIMSYGLRSQSRLSACHAEFLAVHPFFNRHVEGGDTSPPTIELISPATYPAGATTVSVRLKLSDPDGLNQVFLAKPFPFYEVWGCFGLAGKNDATVEFEYDGYSAGAADWSTVIGIADFETHLLTAVAVDTDGNVREERIELSETEGTRPRPQTLEKILGDNQQEQANAPLAQPLVVEVRDQRNNPLPNAQVTFAVVAGEGVLSGRYTLETAMTDANGRAERTLTVGVGRTIVEVTIQDEGITRGYLREEEITQTRAIFNAIGVGVPTVSMMNGDYQRWHLPDGATMRLGKGRLGECDRAVAFSPEGQLLAVASGIGVWLYDATTSRELTLLPSDGRVHSVAFSTNGNTLAAGVRGHLGGVILWDIATRSRIASFIDYNDAVNITSVSFSSDGKTIAFMTLSDEKVKLWHVPSGNITTLEDKSEGESGGIILYKPSSGPTIAPQSVAFSPDGRLLAAGSTDGTIKLWDVGTQRLLAALPGHRLRVYSVAFSRDGKLLASGSLDETVRLWNVMKRENIATLRGHRSRVNSVTFSPDGRTLASGAYGGGRYATIKLWDIASEQNINPFATLEGGAQTVSFSTDGSILASGGEDGTVKLWDVATGNVEFAISGHTSVGKSVAFSPQGSALASGSTDGTVKLWDIATGRHVETFGPHALRVNAVAFSPDGTLLVTGSDDRTTKLWDAASGTAVDSRFTFNCSGRVNSLAFSPDGEIVASGDSESLLLWNSATGEQISTPFGYARMVSSVAFSPDPGSSLVAFGSQFGVKLWDVAAHTPVATLGDAYRVDSVAFSPDGSRLASAPGNQQQPMTLWNVLTGRKIGTFAGSNYNFPVLSFSPSGAILASGGEDNTIKLWDVATQRPLAILEGHNIGLPFGITSLSFSDDMVLASGSGGDGTVLLWDLSSSALSLITPVSEIIPDPNLRTAVAAALGVESGEPIHPWRMAELDYFEARESEISDLTGIGFATSLSSLILDGNSISEVSAVAGLTKLEWLLLGSNNISDISPLVANTGLGDGDTVDLRGNPLSNQSIHTYIPTLKERGVTVEFDAQAHPALLKISGGNQRGLPGEALPNPFVIEAQDANGSPLVGVPVTFTVTVGGGRLSSTRASTNANGRAQSTLMLGPNPGTNTVTVAVNGIQEKQTFFAKAEVVIAETVEQPPQLQIISGQDQEGLPGAMLEQPFVVEVRDLSGNLLPGARVRFSATAQAGGGTLSTTRALTDAYGRAQSTLTLGPNPGTNSVKVSVFGIDSTLLFLANAIVPLPKSTTLSMVSGNNQTGALGETLMQPFVVKVHDESENRLEGITVNFTVTWGGGTLSVARTTTDDKGRAQSTLTLGPNPGTNTVTVAVTGIQEKQTFVAEATGIAKTFVIVSGEHQEGPPGLMLEQPFVVEVRDQSGDPFPGARVRFTATAGGGTLSTTRALTDANGRAQSTLTLGPNPGTNTVTVSVSGIQQRETVTAVAQLPPIPGDVNMDDVVNILDLVLVASDLGAEGVDLAADVNEDGVVNILDLVLVAGALGNAAAAPSAGSPALSMPTATDVGEWLAHAREADLTDTTSQRGVLFLEQLLALLTPKETTLLPNYPNPFNPETWIPYRLAEDSLVTLTIYDGRGRVVRALEVGHQLAAAYEIRSKAIYWDGKNRMGEPVASGVYFYNLTTGDYSATRKMLILK